MRILFLFILLSITATCISQNRDSSFIIDTGIHFINPDKFYVSDVVDSRDDKAINAFCVASVEKGNITKSCFSLPEAVKKILDKKLTADSNLAPIIIDIKKFSIIPALPRNQLQVELRFQSALNRQIEFAFYSFNVELYKYMKSQQYFSEVVKNILPDVIMQLNRLVNNLYNDFPFKGVKIISRMQPVTNNADTFFYKRGEQLSWKDFKGLPDGHSPASAISASSFFYNSSTVIKEGVKIISVNTVCYFLKKNSWVKPDKASQYVLEHERLHFTITYLWALKFSRDINTMDFFTPFWQTRLSELNKEYFRQMNTMQVAYDNESENGLNEEKQRVWVDKINSMIKESLPEQEGFLPDLMK